MLIQPVAVAVLAASRGTPPVDLARTMGEGHLGDLSVQADRTPVGTLTDRDIVTIGGEMVKDPATVSRAQSREYEPA